MTESNIKKLKYKLKNVDGLYFLTFYICIFKWSGYNAAHYFPSII